MVVVVVVVVVVEIHIGGRLNILSVLVSAVGIAELMAAVNNTACAVKLMRMVMIVIAAIEVMVGIVVDRVVIQLMSLRL